MCWTLKYALCLSHIIAKIEFLNYLFLYTLVFFTQDVIPSPFTNLISDHQQSSTLFAQQHFCCMLFDLCVSVAETHPDSLRGMQMMVHYIAIQLTN